MTDVDRVVWKTVRRGDRKGTALDPGVVFARTGVRVGSSGLAAAVERLTADGRLYWRDPRMRRHLLAGPWAEPAASGEVPQPVLDGLEEINDEERGAMSDIESTETRNDFGLSGNRRGIAPMLPVVIHTKQQAYRTAAWIKLLSEILPDEFPASSCEDVEAAIANT